MDPALIKQLALGGIPPAIAGAVLFFTLRNRPARPSLEAATTLLAFLIVLGTIALAVAPPAWRFTAADDRLPFSLGILAALAIAASSVPQGIPRMGLAAASLAGATAFGLLAVLKSGGAVDVAMHLAGASLAGAVIAWAAPHAATPRETHTTGPALARILVPLIGASQLLVIGMASLKHGQVAGMFAAIAGGAAAAWIVARSVRIQPATATFLWLGAMLLTTFGIVLGSAPMPRAVLYGTLIATSMVLSAISSMGPLGRLTGFKGWATAIGLPFIPIAAGLAVAVITHEDPYDY